MSPFRPGDAFFVDASLRLADEPDLGHVIVGGQRLACHAEAGSLLVVVAVTAGHPRWLLCLTQAGKAGWASEWTVDRCGRLGLRGGRA